MKGLRILARILILPVRLVVDLLLYIIEFAGTIITVVSKIIGTMLIVAMLFLYLDKMDTDIYYGWDVMGMAIAIAVIPEAVITWGFAGLLHIRKFLAMV